MTTVQRLDDNPCRPRHFKPPPPCAPVVADERANRVLETCRTRLVATAALFAVVFAVVVLRLAEVTLLSAGSAAAAGTRRHRRSQWRVVGDNASQAVAVRQFEGAARGRPEP